MIHDDAMTSPRLDFFIEWIFPSRMTHIHRSRVDNHPLTDSTHEQKTREPSTAARHFPHIYIHFDSSTMSSSMCVVETSTAGREYKVRDMAQADFGCVRCAM